MTRHSTIIERPGFERPHGESRAVAYLIAEGTHWAATGHVTHDESEPMGRLLKRMDELEVVPRGESYINWLMSHQEGLDGIPLDYLETDDLEPLEKFLDRYEERSGSASLTGHGSS